MSFANKIIVAISGASGAIYAISLLKALKKLKVETHLVVSKAGGLTISEETDYTIKEVKSLADYNYNVDDIGAAISSGSFKTMGMVVVPCSVKTMSEIACGVTSNLVSRAADVQLKERRKLVLMVRETPFHLGHLRNMVQLTEMGAIISPPLPAFYPRPENIDDLINHSVGRLLDLFDLDSDLVKRWKGLGGC
ncbi:UbiX family flavin prenyltransferase [Rickettsiales bacterium]|nr:UbiX family flavin prenyltransferase [Rickettsiales bacterium]